MRDELKRKLSEAMAGPLDEKSVTYILVKVRELIDSSGTANVALTSYCDWTVHTTLSYNSRTRPFLLAIDGYLQHIATHGDAVPYPDKDQVESLYYLEDFRQELRTFLANESLPTDITVDARWFEFLKAYAGIVHQRSMTYSGGGIVFAQEIAITTAAFSAGGIYIMDSNGSPVELPFGLNVAVTKKDGSKGSLSLPSWRWM